jgi:peptidyl-prolyl cis-trans isomerase B (cyclophilin B)
MRTIRMMFALVLVAGIVTAAYGQMGLAPLKTYEVSKDELAKMAKTTAVIETKFGAITVKFFPDVAPQHVKNFLELARQGFYNKTAFHRVAKGFMIQGGDPISKDPARQAAFGTGGPGYTIKAEFNKRPHKRGTLSMARTNMPDTAGSQFFICVNDAPFLDGQYTVFGEVVSGMEVVDKIVALQVAGTEKPSERVEIQVKIVDEKK